MPSPISRTAIFALVATPLILLFQNCGSGLQTKANQTSNLGSTNGGGGTIPDPILSEPPVLGIRFFDSSQTLISGGVALSAGQDYTLYANGYAASDTLNWSLPSNSAGCFLMTNPAVPFMTVLRCSTSGSVSALLSAVTLDGTSKRVILQHTMGPSTPDYCSPNVGNKPAAVFRISNGTGAQAWNLAAAPIAVAVGQTLRICNDDAANHQLKTAGLPCATQPTAMTRGQFYDCLVTSTTTAGMSDAVSGASFSVTAYDGRALFSTNCASCHGTFPGQGGRNATGASGSTIDTLIKGNQGGMGAIRLTPEQLNAIGYSLSF